jgi:hypothetical protein
MELMALALFVIYGAVGFGIRTCVQIRRTGTAASVASAAARLTRLVGGDPLRTRADRRGGRHIAGLESIRAWRCGYEG